jgi:hypothetical protein
MRTNTLALVIPVVSYNARICGPPPTGYPRTEKGVMLSHRNLIEPVRLLSEMENIGSRSRLLQFCLVRVDVHLLDIFCAMFNSAIRVLVSTPRINTPSDWSLRRGAPKVPYQMIPLLCMQVGKNRTCMSAKPSAKPSTAWTCLQNATRRGDSASSCPPVLCQGSVPLGTRGRLSTFPPSRLSAFLL